MPFVLLILGAHIAGVCTVLALLPVLTPHLRGEMAWAIGADAVFVTGLVLVNWLLEDQGSGHCVAEPVADTPPSREQEAPQGRYGAHEFCLRHLGLQHALMLSVPEKVPPSPPDRPQHSSPT